MSKAKHSRPEEIVIPELEALVGTYGGLRRRWSEGEENILIKYYGSVPTAAIAKQLGRTVEAVETKAGRLKRAVLLV